MNSLSVRQNIVLKMWLGDDDAETVPRVAEWAGGAQEFVCVYR